ncbi:MAG: TatD family deoxyribonuclease [Acidimicrobiia bacterium]|nr:TatD family deoxyribonuclease [Acidimicrobiia bacterium]
MARPAMERGWVDSHCHLPDVPAEAAEVVDRARAAGVAWMVAVGTDLATSRTAVHYAEEHDNVYATVGLHPHDALKLDSEWPELRELATHPRVVAIGETGFDLFYEHSPRDEQATAFRAQIQLAHELDRALVIHSRDAWDETFAVLDAVGVPPRTVFHCFTGGPAEAKRALSYGARVSFSGIITFKNADDVRAAASVAPATHTLIETDSPFLAPSPHRGTTNEPANVALVGESLASVTGRSREEVMATTSAAATAVFLTRS